MNTKTNTTQKSAESLNPCPQPGFARSRWAFNPWFRQLLLSTFYIQLLTVFFSLSTVAFAQPEFLTISPQSLNFGEVRLGESASAQIHFQNSGSSVLNVLDIVSSTPELSVDYSEFPLGPEGGSWLVTVTFTPDPDNGTGAFSGALTISSDDPGAPEYDYTVTATVTATPILSVFPSELNFALIPDQEETQEFTLYNTGYGELNWEIPTGDNIFGTGNDGELFVSSGETYYTDDVRTPTTGDNFSVGFSLAVENTAGFSPGDEALVISMQDPNENLDENVTGTYETHTIESVDGNTLFLITPLANDFMTSTGAKHQAVRVPNYTDVTVDGTLTCSGWDGATGGVIFFRATGTTTVNGSIDASGKGYRGGAGLSGVGFGDQGESIKWVGESNQLSNAGGGGGGHHISGHHSGGGGGASYGESGEQGLFDLGNAGGHPGIIYGDQSLIKLFMGSGGGGGADGTGYNGGNGGGIIKIGTNTIFSYGNINCNGYTGNGYLENNCSGNCDGGGGGSEVDPKNWTGSLGVFSALI